MTNLKHDYRCTGERDGCYEDCPCRPMNQMSPVGYAEWFISWAGEFGAAMNVRRDITMKKYRDEEDRAFLEASLVHICATRPAVTYIGDQYLEWKKTH